jgi:hypothetical protein
LAPLAELAYLNLHGTEAMGFPLVITNGCCNFVDAAHPYCIGQPGAAAACAAVVQAATQAAALLAFKASGSEDSMWEISSWRSGTDPCGVPRWAGVTCSGGAAPAVTGLVLYGYDVAGQIGTLAPLAADLTRLDLQDTDAAGDVAGLAPLVRLTYLALGQTKVTGHIVAGDIADLAPLTGLTELYLGGTAVAGDVKGLTPLVELTRLSLTNTEVAGQAAALAPLTRLTALWLDGTAVAGCAAFCGAGGPFHSHCDPTCDNCDCWATAERGPRPPWRYVLTL